jgi:RNA polymerase-associated protein CTR9
MNVNQANIKQKGNIMAMIGEALIKFNCGEIQNSLRLFKKILSNNPAISLPIRFAIGACYYRLENFEKAELAFERQI